jgi:hypothetical protein
MLKGDTDAARQTLRATGRHGFGDHVRDPLAFAMRSLWFVGWLYTGGRIGKSTFTMTCPTCTIDSVHVDGDPPLSDQHAMTSPAPE